jgi:hypothetical protein
MAEIYTRAAWLWIFISFATALVSPPLRVLGAVYERVHEHADPQPHSRHLAYDVCSSIGQTCSTSSAARVSCAPIGSNPGFCNFSSYVNWDGTSYDTGLYGIPSYPNFNGTCTAVSPSLHVANVYGKPCSTTFECNSFAPL